MSFFHRLFKFRIFKSRTSLTEELDDLHGELTHLQQNLLQTRLLQQQWTKWFAIYAILAYLITNISYYTFVLSRDFIHRMYAFTISIALGVLLYGIHWMMRWYFRRIIQMKEEKLVLFKERKQDLIEEVKNKETYAIAKNLLEKYGETLTPVSNGHHHKKPNGSSENYSGRWENGNHSMQTPVHGGSTRLAVGVTPGRLPRAILPPQRTFWGTMLDTIVGDGPSKRYALICKSCNSHNGMALDDEFEYLSFRCAYCNYFNGARKQKPIFNPDLFSPTQPAQNGTTNTERMDMSVTDSSDSTDPINESRITRRSIRLPTTTDPHGKPSRSFSVENKRTHNPILSSSEESLSDKTK